MAVVFPAPAGGDRQLPMPRSAHLAAQVGLPSIQGSPVRRHLSKARSTAVGSTDTPP